MKKVFLFIIFISYSLPCFSIEYLINLGTAISNDKIETLAANSDFDLAADSGLHLNFAAVYPIMKTRPYNFELQLGLGAKTSGDKRDNEDKKNLINWDRFPLELSYFFRHHRYNIRLGYGLIYQINGSIKGEGLESDKTLSLIHI